MRMDRLGVAQVLLLVLLVMLISAWVALAALPDGEQSGRDQKGQQRDSAALRTTVDDVDLALVSVSQEEDGEAAEVLIPMTCDRIGDDTNRADNTNIYRGNIYSVEHDDTVLTEIKMELAFSGEIKLHFSVRRALSDAVPQVFSADGVNDIEVTVVGDGFRKLYSTGPINISLQKGFDYAIGVSWTITSESSSVNYFNDSLTYPRPYTHGETLKRVLQNVPPPLPDDHIFTISTTTGAYSMELCFDPVEGACCSSTNPTTPMGLCQSKFEQECLANDVGAFYHGDRTRCSEIVCRYGACCDPCGTCQAEPYTEESCAAIDGTFQLNAACPLTGQEELCPKTTGACCHAAGGCDDTTCERECVQRGDKFTYQGDGTTCQPNMCAGACCNAGGEEACSELSPEACTADGGQAKALGTTCATLSGNDTCNGACCSGLPGTLDDCDDFPRFLCAPDLSGESVYLGDGTSCPADCGLPTDYSACCLNDGSCINTTQAYCDQPWVLGEFNVGEMCGPDVGQIQCETAACCFEDGSCQLLTFKGCENLGGDIWHSNIPLCELNTCAGSIPTGACCDLVAGVCEDDLTRQDCENRGDLFQDVGSTCATLATPCSDFGACCREDGECFDAVTCDRCALLTGSTCVDGESENFHAGTTCVDPDITCNRRGACCTDTAGCLLTTSEECAELTNVADGDPDPFQDIGSACLEETCPSGACCLAADGGTCERKREDRCRVANGFYQGRQTTCEAGLCTLGACCTGGTCTDPETATACTDGGGTFSPRAVCNANACVSGACCVDGDCLFETKASCDSSGGFYQGPNAPCGAGICDLGRCCMEAADPLCDVVEAQCSAASSIPFEPSVACGSPLPCEEIGACCPILGDCRPDLLTSECEAIGGQFTPNTVCGEQGVVCPVRGACCSDRTCEEVTSDECDARGGVYQGDGNACFVGLCTLGSCCVGGGFSCAADLVTSQCTGLSDIFRADLDCTVGCDLPGACCLTEGVCVDDVLQSVCALHNGSPSPGAPCNSILCLAQGACCGPTGTCTFGTVGECGAASVYLGDGTACGEDSCPTGACCHDGQCDELTESACSDVEGLFDGEGTGCSSDRCEVGCCCHLDGTFEDDALRLECEAALDEFRQFEACADFCTPRGACCPEVGDCQDRKTQTQCTNDGGSFGGAGSACQADTCDFGGCCLVDVGCRELETLFSCQQDGEDGGTFLGAGVLCDLIVACARGACCRPDGFCDADVLGVACAEPNVFQAGSTCEEAACVVFGACCLEDVTGPFCDVLPRTECLDAGGSFSSTNAVCQPSDFCLPGACCQSPPLDLCEVRTRRVCDIANGIYQGAGTVCGDECLIGACCQLDGTCDDALMQTECLAGIGDFTVGVDCSQTMCEPRGACCGLSGCTIQTRSECLMNGNTFQGIGIACGADTCSGINNSDPADCTIDARQPTDPDGAGVFGWDSVEIVFDAAVAGLTPASFTVSPPWPIASVVTSGLTARLTFDAPIPPGQWTCVTHDGSGGQVCLGYLPGDTDHDEIVSAADIAALVDCISGAVSCDLWQCDLNQSGTCGPADLLRGIDLLGGAESFMPGWLGESIGACPSIAP